GRHPRRCGRREFLPRERLADLGPELPAVPRLPELRRRRGDLVERAKPFGAAHTRLGVEARPGDRLPVGALERFVEMAAGGCHDAALADSGAAPSQRCSLFFASKRNVLDVPSGIPRIREISPFVKPSTAKTR